MRLVIEPGGRVRCLYGEAVDLASLGVLTIRRASHVEPDRDGAWWADLSPVGGPRLGPFVRRSLALAAEETWLEDNWLESPLAFPSSSNQPGPLGS
jgi:hypothetical protein